MIASYDCCRIPSPALAARAQLRQRVFNRADDLLYRRLVGWL